MALILKQSTAVDVLIGPFVDSDDAYTAETGLSPSVRVSKNGQNVVAKNDVTTPVHDENGYYNCELDATDTNTVGTLVLFVVGSATSLPVRHEFQVVEEATYDFLFANGATPIADINAQCDSAISDASLATAAALATVDTNVDAILVDTAEIGAAGAGLTAVPWNASWDAEVQSEVTDALNAYDPPTKAELDSGFAALNDIAALDVWHVAAASVVTASTIGLQLKTNVDAVLSDIETDTAAIGAAGAGLTAVPWNASWDAEVQSEVTDALNAYDPPTKAELDSGLAALNDLTAAQVNAEVDTALADYDGPTNAEMEARTLTAARITQLSQNLDNSLQGTASGIPTTTSMVSDIGVTVDNQFVGRTIIFDDDTSTAALQNQATDITACTASSNTLTFTALTTAPSSGDTFVIV